MLGIYFVVYDSLLTNAIFCTECFNKSKDKHKNHNVIFKPYSNGFCDCGDANSIIKESFCPDHNGPFTNEKEIMNFINTNIGENNVNIIEPLINNIFVEITKKIDELSYSIICAPNNKKVFFQRGGKIGNFFIIKNLF